MEENIFMSMWSCLTGICKHHYAKSKVNVNITTLPNDILVGEIISRIAIQDEGPRALCQLSCVCKYFNKLVKDPVALRATNIPPIPLVLNFPKSYHNFVKKCKDAGNFQEKQALLISDTYVDKLGTLINGQMPRFSGWVDPVKRTLDHYVLQWVILTKGAFTINCSGSCFGGNGWGSFGGAARDNQGRWQEGFCGRIKSETSITAQLWGIRHAIALANRKGWIEAVIKSDCLEAVECINNKAVANHPERMLIEFCINAKEKLQLDLVYVPKEANKCADRLAKNGRTIETHYMWVGIPDDELLALLSNDSKINCYMYVSFASTPIEVNKCADHLAKTGRTIETQYKWVCVPDDNLLDLLSNDYKRNIDFRAH